MPPPALASLGTQIEGAAILEEVRGDPGLLLWESLRDALLWIRAGEDERTRLFAAGAEQRRLGRLLDPRIDGAVRTHLAVISGVLRNDGRTTPEELAVACHLISRWAEERAHPWTAISFAQAAAEALPLHARSAYHVGLLCRRFSEYDRAETWFRRSIVLARRRDPETYALSFVGLGNLCMQRGSYRTARELHLRALRTARRKGLRRVKAITLHDLIGIAAELKQTEEAERYVKEAFRAYPPTDRGLPGLASDVGRFWMLQGFHERAMKVLAAVAPLVTQPGGQLITLSNLARASGGAGDRDIFLQAWITAWRVIDQNPAAERVCAAALNLAYGAANLDDWERVELAAEYALNLASRRGEAAVQVEAQALLAAAREKTYTPLPSLPPAEPEVARAADELAEGFVRKLAVYAGAVEE